MVAWTVYETDCPEKSRFASTIGTFFRGRIIGRGLAGWAFIEGGVSVSDSYRDTSTQLLGVTCCPDPRQSLNYRTLSVVYVTESSDVDLRLYV